jgi:hypothetical protein
MILGVQVLIEYYQARKVKTSKGTVPVGFNFIEECTVIVLRVDKMNNIPWRNFLSLLV